MATETAPIYCPVCRQPIKLPDACLTAVHDQEDEVSTGPASTPVPAVDAAAFPATQLFGPCTLEDAPWKSL